MAEKKFENVRCTVCNRQVNAEVTKQDSIYTYYKCPNVGDKGQTHHFNLLTEREIVKSSIKTLGAGLLIANTVSMIWKNRKKIGDFLESYGKGRYGRF